MFQNQKRKIIGEKSTKKYLATFLVMAIILVGASSYTSLATTVTLIMDSDALASSGTTNPPFNNGWSWGHFNMNTYLRGSTHYNGDARRGLSYNPHTYYGDPMNAGYVWLNEVHPVVNTINSRTLHVYVWDVSFTDPSANYQECTTNSAYDYGVLNQDRAKGGWNQMKTIPYRNTKYVIDVLVTSSMTKGTYLGADAVKVVYTY